MGTFSPWFREIDNSSDITISLEQDIFSSCGKYLISDIQRERHRQANRLTDRHIYTDRLADRQIQTGIQSDTDRQTNCMTHTNRKD